ncbi:MAG: helix-turn-helix domain-containing protein [Myxococcota bacterium]
MGKEVDPADVPLPGRPVRGSSSGRPITAALNLLSRRWVLRVLWELREGPSGFREMRARCDGMSPDTLSTRLQELQLAGLVRREEDATWRLTELGESLRPAMIALDEWARHWARLVERGEIPATRDETTG